MSEAVNTRTFERGVVNPMDITNYTGIPWGLFSTTYENEISSLYGNQILQDLARIIGYYQVYETGADFFTEGSNGDYVPADLKYTRSASLIDKQARFIFGKPAEFIVNAADQDDESESTKKSISVLQDLLDVVMEQNAFPDKCLKGFKDCCIGERIAITVDFNPEGIAIKFLPAYAFISEKDAYDRLTKLITFYTIHDNMEKDKQRIYRKKWVIENGVCVITEEVYDGNGLVVKDAEENRPPIITKFKYIPAWVVLNDGLTGDENGVSDIKRLQAYEEWYSKLANADIDAGRQGMNPVRWARDMSPESTENLSIAAGAFWDLVSASDLDEGAAGEVGVLETAMSYSEPLSKTLDRLATEMNDSVDVPNINADSMSGVITSGKTLSAVYWSLIMRSDEKMICWKPALRFIANTIIQGSHLYPESTRIYMQEAIPNVKYTLSVDNPYSLPEDDNEEKALDLQEVNNQVMSRKTYIKKWQGLTDKEADKELLQIVKEQQLMENSYAKSMSSAMGTSVKPIGERGDSNGEVEKPDATV